MCSAVQSEVNSSELYFYYPKSQICLKQLYNLCSKQHLLLLEPRFR